MARIVHMSRPLHWMLLVVFSVGVAIAFAQAQDEEEPVLVYRQKLMAGQRASMGAIGDILKYKLPYSTSHIAVHAKNIHEFATLIPDAFEKEMAEGRTDAKPEVWSNWDDFLAKAKTLSEASAKLAETAEGGDMRAVMQSVQGLGNACRGCHNEYRKPEEERFER